MKKTLVATALMIAFAPAYAGGEYYEPTGKPIPRHKPPVRVENTYNTAGAAASSFSASQAYGGVSTAANYVPVTVDASPGLSLTMPKLAPQAPDVISYPTAPCRIAIGASGSGIWGSVGFNGSVTDENCARIEKSRHMHNLGQQTAAVQIMCYDEEARTVLELTGTKCLVSKPTQETVKP